MIIVKKEDVGVVIAVSKAHAAYFVTFGCHRSASCVIGVFGCGCREGGRIPGLRIFCGQISRTSRTPEDHLCCMCITYADRNRKWWFGMQKEKNVLAIMHSGI